MKYLGEAIGLLLIIVVMLFLLEPERIGHSIAVIMTAIEEASQ